MQTHTSLCEECDEGDVRLTAEPGQSTLETSVEVAREGDVEPPAVTVVGDVVAVRERVADALDRGALAETERADSVDGKGEDDSDTPGSEQRRADARVPDDAGTPAVADRAVADRTVADADVPPAGRTDADPAGGTSPTVRYPLGPTVEDD